MLGRCGSQICGRGARATEVAVEHSVDRQSRELRMSSVIFAPTAADAEHALDLRCGGGGSADQR
jgi:hypothetical protein